MITICPDCQRKVLFKTDGCCPSCGKYCEEFDEIDDTPPKKVSTGERKDNSNTRVRTTPSEPWTQNEDSTPNDILKSLRKCVPLSDPTYAWLIMFSTAIGQGFASDIRLIEYGEGWSTFFQSLLYVILLVNTVYIFFSGWKNRGIFLRAFSNDSLSETERIFLAACMPRKTRIEGIRAPRKRPNLISRLMLEPWAVFHYLGSPNFSLEAGKKNWLARLLATLSQSNFAVIDVRKITQHVETELKVCWKCCGPARLFILIDKTRSEAEWINFFHEILSVSDGSISSKNLILMPKSFSDLRECKDVRAANSKRLESVPKGKITVGRKAFDEVKSLVSPADWRTRFFELPMGQMFAMIGIYLLVILLVLLILPNGSQFGLLALMAVLYVIFFVFYFTALARAFKMARKYSLWGKSDGVSVGFVVYAVFVGILAMLSPMVIAPMN